MPATSFWQENVECLNRTVHFRRSSPLTLSPASGSPPATALPLHPGSLLGPPVCPASPGRGGSRLPPARVPQDGGPSRRREDAELRCHHLSVRTEGIEGPGKAAAWGGGGREEESPGDSGPCGLAGLPRGVRVQLLSPQVTHMNTFDPKWPRQRSDFILLTVWMQRPP